MKPKNQADSDDEEDDVVGSLEDRTKDYSGYKYIIEQLGEVWAAVEKGYEDKNQQNKDIDECWDAYHCVLNENQVYSGNSQIYVPLIRDAMTARETRFINMLFPSTGRYVEITSNDGKVPYELIALMDYYVRQAHLRDTVMPGLVRSGDVSGNYALYVEWCEHMRHITSKKRAAELETELGTPVDGSPEFDDMEYDEVVDQRPGVMVLDPRNLLVLPVTVDSIEDAEIVSVTLRFTRAKLKKWAKDGILEKDAVKKLLGNMSATTINQQPDTGKKAADAVGISTDSKGNKVAIVQQVWCKLKIKGEHRMMVTHFAGSKDILGCKRNPFWCDRIPVLLKAVEKNPDTIWGGSQVKPVVKLQYQANDVVNMGFDSAQYALLPIVMTDPEKNPRAGSMVLAMASVWLTNPNDTKFAEFPPLWKDAFTIVDACKNQIFQSLGVNPAMIPHGNAGKKPTQAQIAQEQQVAMESSADNVALIQEGILAELLEWFYELDYQYRTEAITVKKFGQFGLYASMEQVEPFQVRERYEFKWFGTEGFKATQQVQQMISFMGMLQKVPPQLLNGRKVDIGPMLEYATEVVCGPRLAPHTLIDLRHQLSMSPEMENELIFNNFPVQVHDMDDDQKHIQSHMQAFQHLFSMLQEAQMADPIAVLARGHVLEHIKALKAKAAAQQAQMLQRQGGGGRPGAQLQGPSGPQQPDGAVRPDNMPLSMPRKAM